MSQSQPVNLPQSQPIQPGTRARRALACALTVVMMACQRAKPTAVISAGTTAPGGGPIPAQLQSDKGVPTMMHAPADLERAARFVVDTTAPIELGQGGDPRFDLTYAGRPVALNHGGYAVLARVGARLMIFDSAGHGIRAFDHHGQGPGDFINPSVPIQARGDTLYLVDEPNNRADWILPDKGIVRTAPLLPTSLLFCVAPVTILPGDVVVEYFECNPQFAGDTIGYPPLPIFLSGLQRQDLRVADTIPGMPMARMTIGQHGRKFKTPVAVRFGSRPVLAGWDTLVAIGRNDLGYVIDVRNASGHLLGRLDLPGRRRPVTQPMRDAQVQDDFKHQIMRTGEGGEEPAMTVAEQEEMIRTTPTADSLPAIGAMYGTPGGLLWILDAIAPTDSGWTATAFRLDGAVVGRLAVAGRDRPVLLTDDRVIVRHENADGLITYRIFRLRRPS